MKFRLHPFAESRVRRRMETAAGVVDDHHVPAPVQLGDQKGPDEVVGHPSAGVPIIPDVGGARRDELSRLQPRVDTAKDGDRPMLPFGSHGVLGHSIGVPGTYTVKALVSNNGVPGTTVDARLQNAWGLVAGPGTPWWVSDNGADFSTLYNATGVKRDLNVSVDGAPTGIVFNGDSTSFRAGPSNAGALFIFATEGGTIAGWNPSLGTAAGVKVDSSGAGAIYKGLAIATTATGPQLYATDFHNARVDVFDATWAAVQTAGGFVDPTIPAGYAPFGIQTIGTRIFVTFAKQGLGAKDEIDGQGLGFVDAFDSDGNLVARVAQHGQLNAPWGLALAPASFGRFGGDLLVGNFGDGHVNAYQEISDGTFELIGALRTADGRKLAIDGLWALQFGHGTVNNGPVGTLFFTAGPNDEADGLFGTITAA
ncbi:MAG: TIGR03118 family protein [Methanobacteriota archaeon]|nr:MAG: TIGR03118 family protein [Euryarchaeota archaeon]